MTFFPAPTFEDRLFALERRIEALEEGALKRYLRPAEAATYLGARSAQRVHELKCMGAIVPDGYDGRIPLYTRETLDTYVRKAQ